MNDFFIGVFVFLAICAVSAGVAVRKHYESHIEEACQGKSWVIKESLIEKTLTCEVKLKEKK